MPLEAFIEPNPKFKPTAKQEVAWEEVKKKGRVKTSYVTAKEAVRNSGGMYRIASDKPDAPAPKTRMLEDYELDELKALYFGMGNKMPTSKQLRKADMIAAIRKTWDAVEILDDEA